MTTLMTEFSEDYDSLALKINANVDGVTGPGGIDLPDI